MTLTFRMARERLAVVTVALVVLFLGACAVSETSAPLAEQRNGANVAETDHGLRLVAKQAEEACDGGRGVKSVRAVTVRQPNRGTVLSEADYACQQGGPIRVEGEIRR